MKAILVEDKIKEAVKGLCDYKEDFVVSFDKGYVKVQKLEYDERELLKQRIKELEGEVDKLEDEVSDLRREVYDLEDEVDELKEKLEGVEE